MDIVREITEQYRQKKARWDSIIRQYMELPATERREIVAKLILLEESDARGVTVASNGTGNSHGEVVELAGRAKLLDLVVRALREAGRPMSSPEIYAYARTLQGGIRKNSIETTVSKGAQKGLLRKAGVSDTGLKLYALTAA